MSNTETIYSELAKLRECIGLLNSMVASGESHSEQSLTVVQTARDGLLTIEDAADRMEESLRHVANWANAYPLDMFPEPDFKKAHELLKAGGMTLDAISASNMRHVVTRVAELARRGLGDEESTE